MKEFIENTIKKLVDKPEKVFVEESPYDDHTVEYRVEVDADDVGKVIGKKGKNVNAMRTILTALGAKDGKKATLHVIE